MSDYKISPIFLVGEPANSTNLLNIFHQSIKLQHQKSETSSSENAPAKPLQTSLLAY
jgi:hypothetical protein